MLYSWSALMLYSWSALHPTETEGCCTVGRLRLSNPTETGEGLINTQVITKQAFIEEQ